MRVISAALLLLLSMGSALAEAKYSDRCVVKLVEMTGLKVSDFEGDATPNPESRPLGTFDTIVGEEELTTRAFKLPGTGLFVVASVWYTDESMAGDDSSDSMSLGITISPTPKRDILASMQYAEAEVLMKNFEVARVTTIFKTQTRSFYIEMECRKGSRS